MAEDFVARLQNYGKGLFAGELGVRFVEATAERVCAELVAEDRHCTVPGIVHGGVIFKIGTPDTLADDDEVRRIYLGTEFRLD